MLLLIDEPREPHDDAPPPLRPNPLPHVPWRPFAWFAAFCWLLFAAGQIGGLAGYGLVLVAVALGCWRLDRWMSQWDLGGLRNYTRGF